MKYAYAVVCLVADVRDTNKLNAIASYVFATKKEAEAFGVSHIKTQKSFMLRALHEENYENPESYVVITKEETDIRCHCEMKTTIKNCSIFNAGYDIINAIIVE